MLRLTKEFEFFPKIRPENSCEANPNDKNRPISSQILTVDRCFVKEEAGREAKVATQYARSATYFLLHFYS